MAGVSEAAKYHALRRRLKLEIKRCQRRYNFIAEKDGRVQAFWDVWDVDKQRAGELQQYTYLHGALDKQLHTEPE